MNIESLNNGITRKSNTDLYNLYTNNFTMDNSVTMNEYIVTNDDSMRLDLVFSNMYGLSYEVLKDYIQDIDIIMYINNIENPLNIVEGMVLIYPNIDELYKFRIIPKTDINNNSVTQKLGKKNFPNKTSKVDNNRQKYIENEYSLSPVILDTPKEPVRIINGNFTIGGL